MKISKKTYLKADSYRSYRLITLLLFFIVSNYSSTAQDQPGLSGFVQFSGSHFNFRTNTISGFLKKGISEPTAPSLYKQPQKQQLFSTLGATELRYTFPKRKYQLYFGGSMLDLVRLDLVQQLAIRRLLANNGFLSVGVVGATFPVSVWEDPYVEGIDRIETTRKSIGVRVEWSNILNSNFTVQYNIRGVELKERSGDFLGLLPEEKEMLDRNGSIHRLQISYQKEYGENHKFLPSIVVGYSNTNGEAKKGLGLNLDLTYSYTKNRLIFATNAIGGIRKYQAENPIYDKKQTNVEWGITESIFYRLNDNPKATFLLNTSFAYLLSDSNIDFHTQSGFLIQLGVVLRFGPILNPKDSK